MRYMNLYLSASIPQLETFLAVKKVIDEWDPLHLFPCAPLDEYEHEVHLICKRLGRVSGGCRQGHSRGKKCLRLTMPIHTDTAVHPRYRNVSVLS